MNEELGRQVGSCSLEQVITTPLLESRVARSPDPDLETRALLALHRQLAEDPETFFQKLVDATLKLSKADSAGISLLDESEGRFVWPAVAGPLDRFVGEGTPRDFGPCGTVLDRRMTLLMAHPERHFDYLTVITPPLEEVLLIPFYSGKKPVGTIWAVSHTAGREFDAEDRRQLESLSAFAASAYEALAALGLLHPLFPEKAL